jgi:hypothetical protein
MYQHIHRMWFRTGFFLAPTLGCAYGGSMVGMVTIREYLPVGQDQGRGEYMSYLRRSCLGMAAGCVAGAAFGVFLPISLPSALVYCAVKELPVFAAATNAEADAEEK